jgi:Ca2+-transporting ATPase
LTVTVSAVVLAFVSSIASGQEQSVLTVVQLLWINLIQDTFAALALATDPPTAALLDRKPEPKTASIITLNMWKMIMGQSALQLIITFILMFAGARIFTSWGDAELKTVIFNTFAWLQIFNQINCRRIDNKLNVFAGIQRNWLFISIVLITVGGQILIIYVGGTSFSVVRLNAEQWAISVILGLLSFPFGALIRLVPNKFIEWFIPRGFLRSKHGKTPNINEEIALQGRSPAIDEMQEFLKKLRREGGTGVGGNKHNFLRRIFGNSTSQREEYELSKNASVPEQNVESRAGELQVIHFKE